MRGIFRVLDFEVPILFATVRRLTSRKRRSSATSTETFSVSLELLDVNGRDHSCAEPNVPVRDTRKKEGLMTQVLDTFAPGNISPYSESALL